MIRRAATGFRALLAGTVLAASAAVAAVSPAHADPMGDAVLAVKASGGAATDGPIAALSGSPGSNVTSTMTIENTGTQTRLFRIRVSKDSALQSVTLKKGFAAWAPDPICAGPCVALVPGGVQTFSVVFKLPTSAQVASNHSAGRGEERVFLDLISNHQVATELDQLNLIWNVSKIGTSNHDLTVKAGFQMAVGGAFADLAPDRQAMGAPTIKAGGTATYTATVANKAAVGTSTPCLRLVIDPLATYSYKVTTNLDFKTVDVTQAALGAAGSCTPALARGKSAVFTIKATAALNAVASDSARVEVTDDDVDWDAAVDLITNVASP